MSNTENQRAHEKYICLKCHKEFTPCQNDWSLFCSYDCEISYFQEIASESALINWQNKRVTE